MRSQDGGFIGSLVLRQRSRPVDRPPPSAQKKKPGRRKGSYSLSDQQLSKRMFQARNELRANGDPPTQGNLIKMMGLNGDTRRVREWLKRLGFSSYDDFLQHP